MTDIRVLIGTPAYGGMVHLDYLNSLLDYQRQGLNFSLAALGNESLITRARNTIISYFYHHRNEFSHLLFLDADIHLPAAGLKAMLDFQKDVCGAHVPLKGYRQDGSVESNATGGMIPVENGLFRAEFVATAALLLSSNAVTAVVESARESGRLYNNPAEFDQRDNISDLQMFDVFQVGVVEGEYLSEDYWLCKELRALGFDVYATDVPQITHYGSHGFKIQPKQSQD